MTEHMQKFVQAMEEQLELNKHREPQWPEIENSELLDSLDENVYHMYDYITNSSVIDKTEILKHLADIGNYAMMLYDNISNDRDG